MVYHIQIEYARGASKSMFLNYISFYNKALVQRPAAFKSKFVLYLKDKSFRIRLNKIPTERDRISKRDFKVTYQNQTLPIKDFYFLRDERTFVVCPYINKEKSKTAINYIFNENDNFQVSGIKYSYGNIRDSLGNNTFRKEMGKHENWEFPRSKTG